MDILALAALAKAMQGGGGGGGGGGGDVTSVNGKTGTVVLNAADVDAATPLKYTTLTLAVSDWLSSGNAYSCSKTVTGMTASSIVWLSYSDTETAFTEAQSTDTLTFGVAALPSEAITVDVAFMEGSAQA